MQPGDKYQEGVRDLVVIKVEGGFVLVEEPQGRPVYGAPPRYWLSMGVFEERRATPSGRDA